MPEEGLGAAPVAGAAAAVAGAPPSFAAEAFEEVEEVPAPFAWANAVDVAPVKVPAAARATRPVPRATWSA